MSHVEETERTMPPRRRPVLERFTGVFTVVTLGLVFATGVASAAAGLGSAPKKPALFVSY